MNGCQSTSEFVRNVKNNQHLCNNHQGTWTWGLSTYQIPSAAGTVCAWFGEQLSIKCPFSCLCVHQFLLKNMLGDFLLKSPYSTSLFPVFKPCV